MAPGVVISSLSSALALEADIIFSRAPFVTFKDSVLAIARSINLPANGIALSAVSIPTAGNRPYADFAKPFIALPSILNHLPSVIIFLDLVPLIWPIHQLLLRVQGVLGSQGLSSNQRILLLVQEL